MLYDELRLRFINKVADVLNLRLNNYTKLELARDVPFNISLLIKRYLHDKNINTILNRHLVTDRVKKRPEIIYNYSGSLDRQLKFLTIYIKQGKAINNKDKGLILKSYNKKHEIETKGSAKQYILDHYGNPKSLYRFEVEINSEDSNKYIKSINAPMSLDILFDQKCLRNMYYYFVGRVLRFRKGAKRILDWESILDNTTDKHPSQGKGLKSKN